MCLIEILKENKRKKLLMEIVYSRKEADRMTVLDRFCLPILFEVSLFVHLCPLTLFLGGRNSKKKRTFN